jgi:hypothetical protein
MRLANMSRLAAASISSARPLPDVLTACHAASNAELKRSVASASKPASRRNGTTGIGAPFGRAGFSKERHALRLNGIALPAHVCAQLGPPDSGVGFDAEQPRLGAAPLANGANDHFGKFGGCQWHVLTIGAGEVLSSNLSYRRKLLKTIRYTLICTYHNLMVLLLLGVRLLRLIVCKLLRRRH